MRKRLFVGLAIGVLGMLSRVSVGSEQFCAVGWNGEFTHIDSHIGEIPPSRSDLPGYMQALAYSSTGVLYACQSRFLTTTASLYIIDPVTGDTTHSLWLDVDVRGMAFSSDETLYVSVNTSDVVAPPSHLGTINLSDGSYTEIGEFWGEGSEAQGLAFSPGGELYAIAPDPFPPPYAYSLFTVNTNNAEMHLIGRFEGNRLAQSIAFTPGGYLYALGHQFAQLDPSTGAIIGPVFDLSGDYRGLESAVLPSGARRWQLYE
ncbi:hypothetical protein AMJ85_03985 [candidate division BRC1 bacterium SM23_51]|nr:MAG: hypothetical protein AMJ85_03985 [candidate division BRC1 bacterium SM23_51]